MNFGAYSDGRLTNNWRSFGALLKLFWSSFETFLELFRACSELVLLGFELDLKLLLTLFFDESLTKVVHYRNGVEALETLWRRFWYVCDDFLVAILTKVWRKFVHSLSYETWSTSRGSRKALEAFLIRLWPLLGLWPLLVPILKKVWRKVRRYFLHIEYYGGD